MKKRLNVSVISTLIAITVITFASCTTTNAVYSETMDGVDYVTINEKTDNLITDISFPQFNEYPKLSWAVKNYVDSELNKLKQELKSDKQNKSNNNECSIVSDVIESKELISVLLTSYEYKGGANGETKLKSFNFNTKSNEFENIEQASGLTIDEISNMSRDILRNMLIVERAKDIPEENIMEIEVLIESGTVPNEKYFRNFMINDSELNIYFEPGTVSAYSDGLILVSIELK